LKAGSQDDVISEFECIMTRIPGDAPRHWKNV